MTLQKVKTISDRRREEVTHKNVALSETLVLKKEEFLMKNVQIYPSDKIWFPNDSLSKRLFNLSEGDYIKALEDQDGVDVFEKKNHRKFGNIISPLVIRIDDKTDCNLSKPLDQFDFAVLCACISEWRKENRYTTPSIIYRAISGKFGDNDANPSKIQLKNILQSVDKLRRTQIAINMGDVCEKLNYNGGKSFNVISAILPCEQVADITINGKEATVIHLLEESPLLKIAEMKNGQLLSCDSQILNIPRQNNTRMNIAVKIYVLRRVLESIAHPKQMMPAITFADMFEKIRIAQAESNKKCDARNNVFKFFEQLQNKKIISAFALEKKGIFSQTISFTI